MNFLEGFNSVSNSGPTQAQRGQGPMQSNIQQMLNAPLQGQGMGPMGAQQPMQQPMQQPFGSALGGMGANSAMSAMRGMGAQKGMMGQMGGVPGQLGMIGQGGQGMPSPQGYNADWSGAPYGFNAQPWNTQPWTNPWASPQVGQQPMQQPPQQTMQQSAQQQYLPAGTSSDIQEFDPKVPGGGMHQQQLAPAPAPPALPPAAAPRYRLGRDPWYGKAGGDSDDPMGGFRLEQY